MKIPLIKTAIILIILLAPVRASITNDQISMLNSNSQRIMGEDIIFNDSFESYDDWLIDFPPWLCIDVDGSKTFGHNSYSWPHQLDPYAFIIFNPSTTEPPMSDDENATPHTGSKYAVGMNDNNENYTNDDWLITPQLTAIHYYSVGIWAKSYSDQYNLERFTISISTTTPTPDAMEQVSPGEYYTVPNTWHEYIVNISNYSGKIYIGIHMISSDSWFLMLDDFVVKGNLNDTIPPITTCTLDGTNKVKVTLTAIDDYSGLAFTDYKLDDGNWTNYTKSFNVTKIGYHTICFYSVDNAGNHEKPQVKTFCVSAPLIIKIKGGIGITVTLTNIGAEALIINGTIEFTGFAFPKERTFIGNIQIGEDYSVKDKILGFGPTCITVTACGNTKIAKGIILLISIMVVK